MLEKQIAGGYPCIKTFCLFYAGYISVEANTF